jgi:muramoyltetrapeptide carboxypeptidase
LGFEVVVAENAFANTLGYAATPEEKADDLNAMFGEASIKAILCSQGGATANSCLPYLDWKMIAQNPKIFMGISDITVLLNAIYQRTGLITFHGSDLIWDFGRDVGPYAERELLSRLMEGVIGLIPGNGERRTIRGGKAEGTLWGGNLECLLKLAGTPYFPDCAASLLFLESYGFSPEGCYCKAIQLEQMGLFRKVKGIVVGHIEDENRAQRTVHMEDILVRVTESYNLPILKVSDFGHNCSNTILPVGVKARMDADLRTLEICEACVI